VDQVTLNHWQIGDNGFGVNKLSQTCGQTWEAKRSCHRQPQGEELQQFLTGQETLVVPGLDERIIGCKLLFPHGMINVNRRRT